MHMAKTEEQGYNMNQFSDLGLKAGKISGGVGNYLGGMPTIFC